MLEIPLLILGYFIPAHRARFRVGSNGPEVFKALDTHVPLCHLLDTLLADSGYDIPAPLATDIDETVGVVIEEDEIAFSHCFTPFSMVLSSRTYFL